jgi:Uma2 family endonuclease
LLRVTQQLLDTDFDTEDDLEIITELDISHLVTEDDTPLDNFQSEVQQRLLVEPLYSSQALSPPFLVAANVGLFYKISGDPIVPDVLLSLGVQRAEDLSQRRNRSYFVWEFGKIPDVCIEIVSNQEGDEVALSQKSRQKGKKANKKEIYAQIGVPYYVVFDPLQQIQGQNEMNGALLRVWTLTGGRYVELTPIEGIHEVGQFVNLETVGLGLTLWEGQFEEPIDRLWLRWCVASGDRAGQVILTGAEGKELERQRADAEQTRADAEQTRADAERQRADRLAAKLRELGISDEA